MSQILQKYDELLSHLNSEDNVLALELKKLLQAKITDAADDKLWRECLEAGGVDNWSWYSESLQEGGYFKDEDEDDE